ncbi:YhjD/YihY/BrkB family envelope integrity protein [Propionicicella superfundia]|uniref:YhjD/YihY/BrkB family envelope integrity protein n=1 Tax=Propionicicella superfundia TaxID=348582 RepID=UPI0003F546A1|nr:YhjD/YihY/BrkB family envelope integrity protein [Propionicicella superfundia]
MREFVERVLANPVVAHVRRANERFITRLGNQSAAAIAYFSVLSMVPILMFAFAVVGATLTVFRPDLLAELQDLIAVYLPASDDLGGRVQAVVVQALENWRAVGIVGLGTGMWSGANWAKNLKRAIRAQMREDYDAGDDDRMFVLDMLTNLGIALVLLIALGVTLGLSSVVTSLSSQVLGWLGLHDPVSGFILSATSLAVSLAAGFALFWFLTGVVPGRSQPRKAVALGSLVGAIGMAALQYLGAIILGAFSNNAAASLFGPVIVLMLFLNIFATLVLMIAAWIATFDEERPAGAPGPVGPDTTEPAVVPAPDPRLRRGFRIGATVAGLLVLAVSAGLAGAAGLVRAVRSRGRSR